MEQTIEDEMEEWPEAHRAAAMRGELEPGSLQQATRLARPDAALQQQQHHHPTTVQLPREQLRIQSPRKESRHEFVAS